MKEAIDAFKGPNGQTVQALRNAATTYGPALRSLGYMGIAANVVEEAAYIVHTGEDKFGRAWASSAHNIMGDVGATAGGMKIGAAAGAWVSLAFPPIAPIAIPIGAAVGGVAFHLGWDRYIKPPLREFYLSLPVPDKK